MVWYTCAHIRKFIHTLNYQRLDFNHVHKKYDDNNYSWTYVLKPQTEEQNKILNGLYQCMCFNVQPVDDCLPPLYWLIDAGHSQLIDWVLNAYPIKRVYTKSATSSAIEIGDLKLVQWLINNTNDDSIKDLMDDAAEYGHVHILDWLHAETFINVTNSPYAQVEGGIEGAIRNGHLHVLQWLHAHNIIFREYTMNLAVEHGHLHIVKWLHSIGINCTKNAMYEAARNGYLDVLIWLHQNRSEGCTIFAYTAAIKNKHTQVLVYLVTHVLVALTFEDFELLIKIATECNAISIKNWLEDFIST